MNIIIETEKLWRPLYFGRKSSCICHKMNVSCMYRLLLCGMYHSSICFLHIQLRRYTSWNRRKLAFLRRTIIPLKSCRSFLRYSILNNYWPVKKAQEKRDILINRLRIKARLTVIIFHLNWVNKKQGCYSSTVIISNYMVNCWNSKQL